MFFENGLHGGPRDRFDAELSRGGPDIALDVWVTKEQEGLKGERLPLTSCCCTTQTLKAASGPPRGGILGTVTPASRKTSSKAGGYFTSLSRRRIVIGSIDSIDMQDAEFVIAHTHPSGILQLSGRVGGSNGDIPAFLMYQPHQGSTLLIGPSGDVSRVVIPRR